MPLVPPVRDFSASPLREVTEYVTKTAGEDMDALGRLMAQSPRALWLRGVIGHAMSKGNTLSMRAQWMAAYVVSKQNACPYCVPGMEVLLQVMGLSLSEIAELRDRVESPDKDKKTDLLLKMAHRSVRESARFGDADRAALRKAGYTPAQIVEAAFVAGGSGGDNLLATAIQVELDPPMRLARHPVFGGLMRAFMRFTMRKDLAEARA